MLYSRGQPRIFILFTRISGVGKSTFELLIEKSLDLLEYGLEYKANDNSILDLE